METRTTVGAVEVDERLWSGRFIVAIAINLCILTTNYMLITTMAMYAVDRFSASDSIAGLASGIVVIGALVARLFAGKYMDFVGRRRMLFLSLGLFLVSGVAYLVADTLVMLLVVRFVQGMAFGASTAATGTVVVGMVPLRRRAEGLGYFGLSMTGAAALGPALAVMLQGQLGYEALLIGASVVAAVALLLVIVLKVTERTPEPEEVARKWNLHPREFIDRDALPISIVMMMIALSYSAVLSFLASYGAAEGMVEAAGVFFLVYAVAITIARLFFGRLQDRRGDNFLFYPALVLFALGMVVLAVSTDVWHVALAAVLIGFGYGPTGSGVQAVAVSMAPEHRTPVAVSTSGMAIDLGVGAGPMLLGLLIPSIGYRGMYLVVVVALLATIVLYHFMHGYRRRVGAAIA